MTLFVAAGWGVWDVIRRAIVPVVLSVLLAACGGGSEPKAFSVSGTIYLQPSSAVDPARLQPSSAVDPARLQPDGQVIRTSSAHELHAVPVQSISGRVAAPTAGVRGDREESRAVQHHDLELRKGQQIVLEFPDSSGADLHLYLLDADGIAIDASLDPSMGPGGTSILSLIVPRDGLHRVRVLADRGRTTYELKVLATVSHALEVRRGPRVSDEFVVHELLVRIRPDTDKMPSWSQGRGLRRIAAGPDLDQLWRVDTGEAEAALENLRGWRPRVVDLLRWASPELRERYETLLIAKGLQARAGVVSVSPNYILRPQRLPNDPLQALQWFHPNIQLPEAWDISTGYSGSGDVIIAVVDTGVFRGHADLQGKLLPGYDFVANRPGGDDPGPGAWHGTHVSGIVGAATDNQTGVAGVSWGVKVMPVRTLSDSGGTLLDTIEGIRYAAGLSNRSGSVPERRADVINLSLGGGVFRQEYADLFREIRDLGIFVVAASGNLDPSQEPVLSFPAAYEAVFAVGATDALNQRAPYSSYGNSLDFVAPGGDMRRDRNGDGFPDGLLSTIATDADGGYQSTYGFYQGTSMATAVASGVVALAKSVNPGLTPDRFAEMLQCGLLTDDIGPAGWDPETGWGQINALKTLRAVGQFEDVVHLATDQVGRIQVRLLNDVGMTIARLSVDPWNCCYPYRFDRVPEGEYWLVAGTDGDVGDWRICAPGQACGAYPTLASPQRVRVDRDLTELNFSISVAE